MIPAGREMVILEMQLPTHVESGLVGFRSSEALTVFQLFWKKEMFDKKTSKKNLL